MKGRWFIISGFLFIYATFLCPFETTGQQIFYSSQPGYNANNTTFEIIGIYGGKLFIYKKEFSEKVILVFDKKMNAIDTIPLKFLPYDTKNLHCIALRDGFIMIYQYQKKRDIYCKAVLFNAEGKKQGDPLEIDQTLHPLQILGDRTYSCVISADRSKLIIYKMVKKPDQNLLHFKTFLLDSGLNWIGKGDVSLPYSDENGLPRQLRLSNDGHLYFLSGERDFIYKSYSKSITLYCKPVYENHLLNRTLPIDGHFPASHPLLTVDDIGHKIWINTFNFDNKKRHLVFLYTYQYDMDSLKLINKRANPFNPELRKKLAEKKNRRKEVFDNYRSRELIVNQMGSALLIGEKEFEDQDTGEYYGDVGLFSLNKEGKLTNVQVIPGKASRYTNENLDSYLLVNTGRALHILLNKSHRAYRFLSGYIYLLRDYRYSGDKQLEKMPVMRKLGNSYQWLPRLGKQVSGREVVIPCLKGGNLVFGKIGY